MTTLHHQVWIDAPLAKVYESLATAEGLGRWWAPHTSTETDDGVVLAHTLPSEEHDEMKMKVLESVPEKRIEWEVVSTHPKRSPASAWTGTHIVYELSEQPSPGAWMGMDNEGQPMAVVDFRHEGWDEDNEFFGFCNSGWGMALNSLKELCEAKP